MGVRFVNQSDKYLSMMNGCRTGMVELDMAFGTFGYEEILRRLGYSLVEETGARFHWGLNFSNLTGAGGILHKMYPQLGTFKRELQKFNAQGTYNNKFTFQLGLTSLP